MKPLPCLNNQSFSSGFQLVLLLLLLALFKGIAFFYTYFRPGQHHSLVSLRFSGYSVGIKGLKYVQSNCRRAAAIMFSSEKLSVELSIYHVRKKELATWRVIGY